MSVHRKLPFLFLAEGVFMYFTEARIKSLVLRLRDHFPGAELVFDGLRPFEIWIGNFALGGLLHWGFWRGQELEGWGDGLFRASVDTLGGRVLIHLGLQSWSESAQRVAEFERRAAAALATLFP